MSSKIRECEECGRKETDWKIINSKKYNKLLCGKCYQQIQRHGKTIKTRYDENEIIEYDNYAEMILYDGNQQEIARTKIDLEDIDKVKPYRWSLNDSNYVRNSYYKGRLHRYLMGFRKGEGKNSSITVDHINRDRLDNRKNNLRICTMQQNNCNTGLRKDSKSGITGVYWHISNDKWVAELHFKEEKVFYKEFDEKEKAIEARKKAEKKYFGEFAPIRKGD